MEMLEMMLGLWEGEGTASYPTITTVPYKDWLLVTSRAGDDAVVYQQQTWTPSDDGTLTNPSHWETGFLVPQDDGGIVALTAHDPRTEVLRGMPMPTDDGWRLELVATDFSNDPRMISDRRVIEVTADRIAYTQDMATQTVDVLTMHLEAELTRST